MKRIVTLFLSLILLLSCLCAPASALFDPSLFYEVQARSAYIVNTDTNIIVYDKDSSRQVPAGGLTKYMTIALLLTNYADQLDNTFQMPFAISDYVHNSDNADMRSNETFTYREAVYAMLLRNANEAAMGLAYSLSGGDLAGWVSQMNTLSQRIGTTGSTWTDACGLDSGNVTTAVDMYLILRYLMSFDAFVDISSAVGRFETFTVTLDGLSPTSRIAFSSNPAQAGANKTRYLLDDIVVVYDGETKLEKLTVPANVKFDAEAVYSDKLTLEWDEVPGAASYTVAWWADGTEEKDATVAEGITSASYLLKELEAGTEYHAKVKACRYNNPGYDSDYSAVVSQKTDIAPVQAGIVVSKVLATSSTLTVEWARADGQACVNSSAQVYHVKLYSDAECKDLFVGWNASNVFGITAGNRFRFTFSGLAPATTYYVCVDDKTNDFFSDPLAYATAAAGPQAGATAPGSAKAGDILLAEDFSKVIHGGDIANFAAGYYPPSSNRGTYAAASGDNPSGFSATRCTANEFDLFSGGGVAAPYTEGTGLSAWGKSGNIAGRPGYVKMGAGSAAASLYTPELTALPDAATVKVRFSAQAYSEKYDGSGADAGKILVKAVRGAVLGAKGAITGTVTEVSAADPVDISAAKARFREFEATLTNVTPDCRIVISTSEKRALLDNVVVTCTAITPATKPAAPGGVSFDAAAAADRLTLKWNAVPDATSYTVAYWKGSASAPESEYAYKTGIASTATSQELTNLESNTSYWAKVKAVGSLDSDWSETANATTMDSGGEPLLPTADLLDVVFRNDGSAMDNSSSATPVRRMPSSRP
ncbi:fibronectin type III domain-containing protein [Alistipes sp.]|uniref:fibronectin type III domain-containing protein n=1 Tax=Alistipes sp. TaxID=1872444 RepID=UPI0023EFB5C8|nr:fibronectin type III domain-containing protein [Alistipes sp.]